MGYKAGTGINLPPLNVSVSEVARTSEVHGHAGGLGGLNHFCVADRAARLHHGLNPGVDKQLQAIGEGEESVRGSYATHRTLGGAGGQDLAGVCPTGAVGLVGGGVTSGARA